MSAVFAITPILCGQSTEPNPIDYEKEYQKAFEGFPESELFRLFIDKKDQIHGENYYDIKEPGYRAAMMKAFAFVKRTLGQPINANFLCTLHDIGIDGVQTMHYTPGSFGQYTTPRLIAKGFTPQANYDLDIEKISAQAKEELEKEKLIFFIREIEFFDNDYNIEEAMIEKAEEHLDSGYLATCHYFETNPKRARVYSNFKTIEQLDRVKEKVNAFCQKYYKERENPPEDYTKLAAEFGISVDMCNKLAAKNRLCRALEIFHFFADGNQRLYAFSLGLKLSIENGYNPAILEEPNVFDGYCSIEKLIKNDLGGMKNFQAYKSSVKI